MGLLENQTVRLATASLVLVAAVGGAWRFNSFLSTMESAQREETSARKADAVLQTKTNEDLVSGLADLRAEVREGAKAETTELKLLNDKLDGHVRRDEWLERNRVQEKIDDAQNARLAVLEGKK